MKISCQSCHSKYNVADEKIQGKIVKIRCRKCGATIVVNASNVSAANGSAPAPAPTPPMGGPEGGEAEWHVSVADNDQRTMSLAELVTAYNTGVVAQDTFIWTEGMGDWKPLSEVDAVVSALHAAAEQPPIAAAVGEYAYGAAAPVAASPAYEPVAPAAGFARGPSYEGAFAAPTQAAPEPRRAAVVKREARARDLFATRSGEEMQMGAAPARASAPPPGGDDSRLTGQRNENSVLFSLDHLAKNAAEQQQQPEERRTTATKDDSGIIDLKALAARAESMRPPTLHDANLGPHMGLAPSMGFASPLGGPLGGLGQEAPPKSKLPLLIGGGAGVALLVVLGIVIGLKIGGGSTPTPMATASASPFPPVPSATAEPAASASASATAQASASASAPVAVKPHPYPAGGGGPKPGGGAKPPTGAGPAAGGVGGAGAGAGGTAGAGAAGAGAAAGGAAPAPKKGDCGCNGDLMCMMKCSTH